MGSGMNVAYLARSTFCLRFLKIPIRPSLERRFRRVSEKILLLSDKREDLELLHRTFKSNGYSISLGSLQADTEEQILRDGFSLVLADYDLIGNQVERFFEFQKNHSTASVIFYGTESDPARIALILHNGIYAFIPRLNLPERIYDAVVGGLENRKAFIKILDMMGQLEDLNESLERERDALKGKNQELNVINRVSQEVAYDLNWERILPRIVGTGLREFFDYHLFGLFYRVGPHWNLALHVPSDEELAADAESLKESLLSRISSELGLKASPNRVGFSLMASRHEGASETSPSLSCLTTYPLNLAGKRLGALIMLPKSGGGHTDENGRHAIGTLANILALSLKNAQEYHRVKEMAVTDSLTGVYNRKGFGDFMKREFHRAKRYHKSLALIMLDVDNFKAINDSFGHLAGDYVLRDLATCLKQSIRGSDIVARYGGDEFTVLLPETNAEEADVFMKRMLHRVGRHKFRWGSKLLSVSVSYGISDTDELRADTNVSAFLQRADSRLYQAKRTLKSSNSGREVSHRPETSISVAPAS